MSKDTKGSKLTLDHFDWDGTKLVLTFCDEILNSENAFKILLQNRKGKKSIELKYSYYEEHEQYIVIIPAYQLENIEIGRWDFYILSKKEGKSRKYRIGMYGIPVASKLIRHLRPINNDGKYSFCPYFTEKNGLSIHCGNRLRIENDTFNVIDTNIHIKDIQKTTKQIRLSLDREIQGDRADIKILFKNENNVLEIPFFFEESRSSLSINKYYLDLLNKNKKWNIYLIVCKGYILERYRFDIQIRMKDSLEIIKKRLKNTDSIENVINGQLSAQNLRMDQRSILFNISAKDIHYANEIIFYLKKRKSKDRKFLSVTRTKSNNNVQIKVSTSQFKEINYTSRWDLYVELHHNRFKEVRRIGQYLNNVNDNFNYCGFCPINEDIGVSAYITNDREFSFYFSNEQQYLNSKYHAKTRLKNISMNKNGDFNFTALIKVKETNNYKVNYVVLRNRQDKNRVIRIPCTEKLIKNKNIRKVKANFNLYDFEYEQFYWDFFISILINNKEEKLVRVRNNNYLVRRKLKYKIFKFTLNKNGYTLYPYVTQNDCLSLTYRQIGEYETTKYKINESVAYFIYRVLFLYFQWKPIWLVYEKYSETAQDNSFYFFKYCYENHYDKKIYYVIKKGSPDERNLSPYKNRVVYFMSIKHLILLLGSKLLVASETKGHSYAWRVNRGRIIDNLNKKKYVFLQHGVLGLKRIENTFKPNSANGAELFVVSSDFEKKIVEKYFGYDEKNIIVTGLARWDAIESKRIKEERREIFLMPTWRNWLEEIESEQFILSDYYKEYNGLLQSKKLNQVLKEYNVQLNFYVHPKFMPYVSDFNSSSSNIKVIQFGEEKINNLLMRASLLITDYSSVAWEMYYQKKPILFFHFDVEKYMEKQGSYMDLKEELFGEVAYNSSELVDKIANYIQSDFNEIESYSKNRHSYFKYIDHNNSSRIYNEIEKREKELYDSKGVLNNLRQNYLIKYLWNKYKNKSFVHRVGLRLQTLLNKM